MHKIEMEKELNSILEEFTARQEKLQDTYDERSCNEPEYDSAIERWEEALDRLQEQIDDLEEINNDFENFMIEFEDAKGDDIENEIESFYDEYDRFNALYKGITPILKKFKKVLLNVRLYNELGYFDRED